MKRVSELRASWVRVVVMAAAAVAVSAGVAQAAVIGTIEHNYGTGAGQVSTPSLGSGTCDTLNLDSITVREASGGCQRFYDIFDFSAAEFDFVSISSFELELTFNSTGSVALLEDWRVRPATSALSAPDAPTSSRLISSQSPQTFVFHAGNLSIFNAIVTNRQFYLWFAEYTSNNLFGLQNFNLLSASLTINGEPKPAENVPDAGSSMLLMGLGFSLVAGASRRLRARRS